MHFTQSRTVSMSGLFSACMEHHAAGREMPLCSWHELKRSTVVNWVKTNLKHPSFSKPLDFKLKLFSDLFRHVASPCFNGRAAGGSS